MKKKPLPPIGIIGFGNMGEAFAAGLQKLSPAPSIMIHEVSVESKARALMQYKFNVCENLADLVEASTIIVIAIKPQDIPALLGEIRGLLDGLGTKAKTKRFISVAAGLKTGFFQEKLGTAQVVRFMPNLAAKVSRALIGVTPGEGATQEFCDQALAVAAAAGEPALMPEKLLAAITGLSGSGIAYVFHFIHALAMGGVREGFPYQKALDYALTTVEGAVELLKVTGEHPIAFESKVCSPSGTTVEGVRVLEGSGFTQGIMDAVSAASRRAGDLER